MESLRWYDKWLKGKNTGIEQDPPVNIWIMGRNQWRAEIEWPIGRTKYVDLYLRPQGMRGGTGRLCQERPETAERKMSYLSWPFSPGIIGRSQLVYRSDILCSEVEVTGHIVLTLYAACIWPNANRFLTGHRIRLEIACTESIYHDFPYVHFSALSCGKVSVISSPEYPSKLTLPLVDSSLEFNGDDAGIQFEKHPSNYFATNGKARRFGCEKETSVEMLERSVL
ncbi:MAG: CocE/NonD family hydrolase C-terminal non-catalytic domain-containing protein [Thermodesulfobacteriota bacterium]